MLVSLRAAGAVALVVIALSAPAAANAARAPTRTERTAIRSAARDRKGQHGFVIGRIRVSTKGPWARANLRPTQAGIDGAVVVLEKAGGQWRVRGEGANDVGCTVAPKQVIADLDLFCDG